MTKEDIEKIMIIIALALIYRDHCDGIINQYEVLRNEAAEILTNHFRVRVTPDDEVVKSEESI